MISMTKREVELAKKQRQLTDLIVAKNLWEVYENDPSLMKVMHQIALCGMWLTNRLRWKSRQGFQKALKAERFLDFWKGPKNATESTWNNLHKKPQGFWGVGNLGGFFRFYAAVREETNKVLDRSVSLPTTGQGEESRLDGEDSRKSWQTMLELRSGGIFTGNWMDKHQGPAGDGANTHLRARHLAGFSKSWPGEGEFE